MKKTIHKIVFWVCTTLLLIFFSIIEIISVIYNFIINMIRFKKIKKNIKKGI